MSEIIIKLEEIDPVEIFGVNNSKLKILQSHFPKLKIVARGVELKVQGDVESLENFSTKLQIMMQHILKKGKLSEMDMRQILNQSNEQMPEQDDQLGDIIVYGNNGKIIKPKTPNQKRLYEATKKNDVVFAIGAAGTGKTYTSVAIAVRALKDKRVKRIILTRPAVEAGEHLGFLPGDLKEKVDPFLRPLYDALHDMIPAEKLRYYMENNVIEVAPLAYMRGRTLDNAFVILDEAQNTTGMQLKMFLTRMGPTAKFLINGDLTQIDLPRKQMSGLTPALQILKNIPGIAMIYLTAVDITRHRLVKAIVAAYDKDSEGKDQKPNKGRLKNDPKGQNPEETSQLPNPFIKP